MATTTPVLGLTKPDPADTVNIVQLNANMDTLDKSVLTDRANTIVSSGVGVVPLTVKGAVGQTADTFRVQNSAGTNILRVMADGTVRRFDATGGVTLQSLDIDGTYLSVSNAAHKPLVVRGFTAQTANIQEWQISGGGVGTAVDPAAYIKPHDTSGAALGAYQGTFGVNISGTIRRVPYYA